MNILCTIFGHKKFNVNKLAYTINVLSTSVKVEVFEVSRCARCGDVVVNRIDWYASQVAKEEEKSLRELGAVTLAEAYKEVRA